MRDKFEDAMEAAIESINEAMGDNDLGQVVARLEKTLENAREEVEIEAEAYWQDKYENPYG